MKIIRFLPEMQEKAESWRSQGKRIGFVPTMGSLHEGHLSLVRIAKKNSDLVVASLFVNPTQFGPQEDFSSYPRDEKGDLEKLAAEKTDFVFLPAAAEMYPEGFQTTVHLSTITQGLCGKSRPGHFDGVATVVLKLFHLVQPHMAVFGEKDYQQLAVIRRMVKDLNLDIQIVGAPTCRTPEGLALSSRNAYLSLDEAKKALCLSKAVALIQKRSHEGAKSVSELKKEAKDFILSQAGVQLEYLEIVDADSLKPLQEIKGPARILVAARVGKTRLIDNGPLP